MGKRILTVDDSQSIRQLVGFVLNGAGYSVEEAADGAAGLAKAQGSAFDLILTDQNMPNMDGLTMIKRLRASPSYARTPILILTTESSDAMKARGRESGATGWVVKPFEPSKLLEVVKKVIG